MSSSTCKKVYYQKRVNFFALLQKIKLWPSRKGIIHGIKTFTISGERIVITTHCQETITTYNSRNGRAARWLRNKWIVSPCTKCRVPAWKMEKYAHTFFNRRWGSRLQNVAYNTADKQPDER